MRIERVLAAVEEATPECIGVAYVDTTMGLLVAVRTVDSHPVEILDQVALAAIELMGSDRIAKIDAALTPDLPRRE